MITQIRQSFSILKEHFETFLYLNIVFFGLMAAAAVYAGFHPEMHVHFYGGAKSSLATGALAPVYDIYVVQRNIPLALAVTFLINLIGGTFVFLSLPSLALPFGGLLLLSLRFCSWGFLFGPGIMLSPATLGTAVLEGEGYIIAGLGIYLHGMRVLRPARFGFQSHKEGYIAGLKLAGRLYWLVAIVLLIAASYEAVVGITTYKPEFPEQVQADVRFEGASVTMPSSGSSLFYTAESVSEGDARVVGLLLEDIWYFRRGVTATAKVSKNDTLFNIELYLPETYWDNSVIGTRFALLIKALEKTYPSRHYQIVVFCLDQAGKRIERRFY